MNDLERDERTRSTSSGPVKDVSFEPFEAISTVKHSGADKGFSCSYQSEKGFTANTGIGECFP